MPSAAISVKWEWPQLTCLDSVPRWALLLIQLPSSLLCCCFWSMSSPPHPPFSKDPSLLSLPPLPSLPPPTTPPELQYKLLLSFVLALSMGAQTAGVQARSALILEMTLRHFYFSASLRHCHGQGLLRITPGQQSRQKENVKPRSLPPTSLALGPTSCFQQSPYMTSLLANLTDCHSLGLSFPSRSPSSHGTVLSSILNVLHSVPSNAKLKKKTKLSSPGCLCLLAALSQKGTLHQYPHEQWSARATWQPSSALESWRHELQVQCQGSEAVT